MVKTEPPTKISVKKLFVSYGTKTVLRDISLEIPANQVLSIIGPANSGKTSFLKTLNRLIETESDCSIAGEVFFDGREIRRDLDPAELRRKIGIIFALPVPLPMTVFENVVYGPRRQGVRQKKKLKEIAEQALREAYLWDEMKDRLDEFALKLSGGQQQRLCIARTLAVRPDVILFDEPCSALDPISTAKIEEAMGILKEHYTIVLVTNNTKQAARVGDQTAFFLSGDLVEIGPTGKIFTAPADQRTEDYIVGRFG